MHDRRAALNLPHHEPVADIPAQDIIDAWRRDFKIDVADLFAGVETLQLLKDPQTQQLQFDPPVTGDAAFYQALRALDWYHPPAKEEFRAAAQARAQGHSVLDVGCGPGGFARYVPASFYRGLETDPEVARDAQQHGLDVLNMDIATYLTSDTFAPADMVAAFQVLEHIPEPDGFLSGMIACTKPGGRIAIGVPDGASYLMDLPDFVLNAPPHHVSWWTEAALKAFAERHGLLGITVSRFEVEPWEKQLWWMAKLARIHRKTAPPLFGSEWRTRKVVSYVGSLLLQAWPIPKGQKGSTLLMLARVPG